MMLQAVTVKNCKVCSKQFSPFQSMQVVCGIQCARKVPVIDRKAAKALTARRKEAVKSRSEHQNETQKAFNAYINARDAHLPCVSCGRFHQGAHHASHYRSVGSSPSLRFDEANVHRACAPCNLYLHGNLIPYRVELLRRIGQAEVDRLEGPHEPKKYTVAELQAMKANFRERTRDLIKARENQ